MLHCEDKIYIKCLENIISNLNKLSECKYLEDSSAVYWFKFNSHKRHCFSLIQLNITRQLLYLYYTNQLMLQNAFDLVFSIEYSIITTINKL